MSFTHHFTSCRFRVRVIYPLSASDRYKSQIKPKDIECRFSMQPDHYRPELFDPVSPTHFRLIKACQKKSI